MFNITKIAAIAAFSAAATLSSAAQAAPQGSNAFVLDTIVVTPHGHYTTAEWQARQLARSQAQAQAVVLATVIVTPSAHYSVAEWQQHQQLRMLAKLERHPDGIRGWIKAVWRHVQFNAAPLKV
jgi:hypothetical protein